MHKSWTNSLRSVPKPNVKIINNPKPVLALVVLQLVVEVTKTVVVGALPVVVMGVVAVVDVEVAVNVLVIDTRPISLMISGQQ